MKKLFHESGTTSNDSASSRVRDLRFDDEVDVEVVESVEEATEEEDEVGVDRYRSIWRDELEMCRRSAAAMLAILAISENLIKRVLLTYMSNLGRSPLDLGSDPGRP